MDTRNRDTSRVAKADPPVRADGRCQVCGKPRGRTIPKSGGLNKAGRDRLRQMLAADPFDSAQCARAYHGVDVAEQPWKDNGARADIERELDLEAGFA
jgi:ribosomal protein S14